MSLASCYSKKLPSVSIVLRFSSFAGSLTHSFVPSQSRRIYLFVSSNVHVNFFFSEYFTEINIPKKKEHFDFLHRHFSACAFVVVFYSFLSHLPRIVYTCMCVSMYVILYMNDVTTLHIT